VPAGRSLFRATLADPRGPLRAAADVLRTRKTRGEAAGGEGGHNEIEMAKADHGIGWLSGKRGREEERSGSRIAGMNGGG
jgi:hypothetical protein